MKKYLPIILALLISANLIQSQTLSPRFSVVWEKSQATGTLPSYIGTGNTERGIGYGVVGGQEKLFLVSRQGFARVMVLNPVTGDPETFLDTTGITGGTFVLNDVEVSADGKIFACNLTTNSQTTAFKVYRWDNLSSQPQVVINFTTSTAYRLGDMITVVGSTADNSIVIYAAAGTNNKVFRFKTTNNGASFTPDEITLSDGAQGTVPCVMPVTTGNSPFYFNSAGRNVKYYDANGTLISTLSGAIVATGSTAMAYFERTGKKYLAVFNYGGGNENLRLVDVTNGLENGALIFTTSSLGTNSNANGTGDIEVRMNNDGTTDLFLLGTNNGIARYRVPKYANITFNLNMKIKTVKGLFNPAQDSVFVRGNFNSWQGYGDKLTDPDGDSIYSITKRYFVAGDTTEFKFVIAKQGQDIWEKDPNRRLIFEEGDKTYNFYFDNDSLITTQAQVTFNVNMRVAILKGKFVKATDLLVIRGSFNGWSGTQDQLSDPD
ncbi:MAG: DUF4623 domain-containing protein, partial [Ignavibacteria bacterium]|nr:DUF4623 domain-containing protein [Ignavibacteria bacterium]